MKAAQARMAHMRATALGMRALIRMHLYDLSIAGIKTEAAAGTR